MLWEGTEPEQGLIVRGTERLQGEGVGGWGGGGGRGQGGPPDPLPPATIFPSVAVEVK